MSHYTRYPSTKLPDSGVTPGSYTNTNLTVNSQGIITAASNGSGGSSPLTTKGDIFGYSTTNARIPVGADNLILTADSSASLGVSYQDQLSIGGNTFVVGTDGSANLTGAVSVPFPQGGVSGIGLLVNNTLPDDATPGAVYIGSQVNSQPAGNDTIYIGAFAATLDLNQSYSAVGQAAAIQTFCATGSSGNDIQQGLGNFGTLSLAFAPTITTGLVVGVVGRVGGTRDTQIGVFGMSDGADSGGSNVKNGAVVGFVNRVSTGSSNYAGYFALSDLNDTPTQLPWPTLNNRPAALVAQTGNTNSEIIRCFNGPSLLLNVDGLGRIGQSGGNIGLATLSAGTVTVSTGNVDANSLVFVTSNQDGGTPGWLRVKNIVANTSFDIVSSSGTDTSKVAWTIIQGI